MICREPISAFPYQAFKPTATSVTVSHILEQLKYLIKNQNELPTSSAMKIQFPFLSFIEIF